jgi:hypothetical protein
MKKITFSSLLMLTVIIMAVASTTNRQTQEQTNPIQDSLCDGIYSKRQALNDIKAGKARLLVQGGIAPIYYPTDKTFRETYKIGYEIFGCVAPGPIECLQEYNETIFKHLSGTYGNDWKNEVRKDVIGLNTN